MRKGIAAALTSARGGRSPTYNAVRHAKRDGAGHGDEDDDEFNDAIAQERAAVGVIFVQAPLKSQREHKAVTHNLGGLKDGRERGAGDKDERHGPMDAAVVECVKLGSAGAEIGTLTIEQRISPTEAMMANPIASQSKTFSRRRMSVGRRSMWRSHRSANIERMKKLAS